MRNVIVSHMHIFRRSAPLSWFTCIAAAGVGGSLYVTLVYAQTDPLQGPVQRLFYFHLASFWAAFIGFTITAGAGIAYLRTRQDRWDRLALAGVDRSGRDRSGTPGGPGTRA